MMAAPPDLERPPQQPPLLASEELFRGAREVAILHAGVVYRLRITSNDKLILTK